MGFLFFNIPEGDGHAAAMTAAELDAQAQLFQKCWKYYQIQKTKHHLEQKLDNRCVAVPSDADMLYIQAIAYKKSRGILFCGVLLVALCLEKTGAFS